jgi:general secretion pathway protein L
MSASFGSLRMFAGLFLGWWLGELKAMWHPVSRSLRRKNALSLKVSDSEWVLCLGKAGQHKKLASIEPQGDQAQADRIFGKLAKNRKLSRAGLAILLPADAALRKRLEMPDLAEADLRQALYFEVDRQTPFQPQAVYFDCRTLGRNAQRKRVSLELIAVPKAIADPILGRVREWGFQPSVLDVAGDEGSGGAGINLLRSTELSGTARRWTAGPAVMGLAFASLLAAVLYIPVYQLAEVDSALASRAAIEGKKAKETMARRDELSARQSAVSFLDQRKRTIPSALLILSELTEALPDTTWITILTKNGSQVRISGYSAAAADLIPAIDAGPLFKNPSFSSPIVQDSEKKRERFDISFDVDASDVPTQ